MQQQRYNGKVTVCHLLDGAKEARGLAVIIDVLRAFSLECYLYAVGAELIRPVGSVEEAFALKQMLPDSLLAGERGGRKCDGFDLGNSPWSVEPDLVRGKTVVHTTSAGTQGIVNACGAEGILTGSLVNARAIADYIIQEQPEEVSLVCMGAGGVEPAVEDELCATYIRAMLKGEELPDLDQKIGEMPYHGAERFFSRDLQDVFPEQDFWLCTMCDCFDFVLKVEKDEFGFRSRKIAVPRLPASGQNTEADAV